MEKCPIRLLVAEDSKEMCDIFQGFFALNSEIELCDVANDGKETLKKVRQLQPDVLLLDIIMPQLDGLSVLEQLQKDPPASPPKIIVTSAISQTHITNQALSLGADYYMIKPFHLLELCKRIVMVAREQRSPLQNAPPLRTPPTDSHSAISRLMLELNMQPHVLGYPYCLRAIELLLIQPGPCSIVKGVYGAVAAQFSTTTECVESAIRKSVRAVFVNPTPTCRTIFRLGGEGPCKPLSNGKFLTTLAEWIKFNH